jgi:SAM-dependent methyltransferase
VHAQDHFSAVSSHYAASRPSYPRTLYEWLAQVAPGRERAWDCACGSGQASIDLADYFSQIVATDLSANQLSEAKAHSRVDYRVAVAESSGLPSASMDVVTVAQALHWFRLDQFYAEIRRVLRPGGVFAAWCYGTGTVSVDPADRVFQDFYHRVVGPYWQPERKLVEDGYKTLPFPQPELATPLLNMELDWSLEALMGYVRSWSATARYVRDRGNDPVPDLYNRLLPSWGDPRANHKIRWPLNVRAAILNA